MCVAVLHSPYHTVCCVLVQSAQETCSASCSWRIIRKIQLANSRTHTFSQHPKWRNRTSLYLLLQCDPQQLNQAQIAPTEGTRGLLLAFPVGSCTYRLRLVQAHHERAEHQPTQHQSHYRLLCSSLKVCGKTPRAFKLLNVGSRKSL